MSAVQLHLISNHLPIILPFAGLIVLVIGGFLKSKVTVRVALFLFVLSAVFTIPTFLSGEEAEHTVEHLEGVEEYYIEEHEEIAEKFALLSYLLGGVSLIAIWASWKQKSFSKIITITTVIVAIITLITALKVGKTGGEIRHPEVREVKA